MAFKIPTLPELAQMSFDAYRKNLKGSDAALWPNNVHVSAKVIAGAVWTAFAFLDYIAKQIFVATADGVFLDRHARDWGMARLSATFASGAVNLTGTAGTTIPSGLVFQRADGVRYTTTSSVTLDESGEGAVNLRAVEAGKAGNAAASVQLTIAAEFAGLDGVALVALTGIGNGSDTESDEALRSRILFRKRYRPRGGAAHDYIDWSRGYSSAITRVYVDPVTASNGRTSVGVWFLMDETYTNGIPQSADATALAAYIETQRPAGAIVDVAAPTAETIDITVSGLGNDTVAVRDAIALELKDLFRREMHVSTLTAPFTLRRSKISEAISRATGEDYHDTTALPADQAITTGRIPVLGTVSFS